MNFEFLETSQTIQKRVGGVFALRVSDIKYDEFAAELGFFYLLALIAVFAQLNRVNGETKRFEFLFSQRTTTIFADQPEIPKNFMKFVTFFTKLFMVLPAIVLIWWVIILFLSPKTNWVGPASVLIIGIAVPCIVFGFANVRWNYFRLTLTGKLGMGLGLFLFLIYQVTVIFNGEVLDNFAPVSAFFLGLNANIVTLILFLVYQENTQDLSEFFTKVFKDQGLPLDPKRPTIFKDELEAMNNTPSLTVNKHELEDIVTIGQVEGGKGSLLEKSSIAKYREMPASKRTAVKGGLFTLSVLVLVVYAAVVELQPDKDLAKIATSQQKPNVAQVPNSPKLTPQEPKEGQQQVVEPKPAANLPPAAAVKNVANISQRGMGIITAVSVLLMDAFAFLLYLTKMISSPAIIALLCVVNRALMVSFGEGYWVYGYMILYIMYATAFVYLIAKKFFPLQGEIILKSQRVDFAQLKEKSAGKTIENKISIFKSPEVLLISITVLYFIFILIVKYALPKDVIIVEWKLFDIKDLSTTAMAGLSVYLVFTFFVFFCLWRTMVRRIKKTNMQELKAIRLGSFLITHQILFTFLTLICMIGWGIMIGAITDFGPPITYFILGSLCLLCLVQAVLYLALNDFDYFQDIQKLNMKIQAHNTQIDQLNKQRLELQQKLRSGQLFELAGKPTQHVLEVFGSEPVTIGAMTQEQVNQLVEAQPRQTEKLYQEYLKEIKHDQEIAEKKRLAKEEQERLIKEKQEKEAQQKAVNQSSRPIKEGDADSLIVDPAQNDKKEDPNTNTTLLEGGEENQTIDGLPQESQGNTQVSADQIVIDIDEAERQGKFSLIAQCKLKEIEDWRTKHNSWTSAYMSGDLRQNDVVIINSLIVLFISWIIMAVASSLHLKEFLGVVISLPLLYLSVCTVIGAGVIYQHRQFSKIELAIWGVINVLYIAIGIIFFITSKYSLVFSWKIDQLSMDKTLIAQKSNNFFIFYVLMVPTVVHGIMVALRTSTTPITQFKGVFKAFSGICVLGLILMIVTCFLFVNIATGVTMLVGMILLIYFLFQVYKYVTNNFIIEPKWERINLILCLVLVVFSTVYSVFSSDLKSYEGVSLSLFVNLTIVWLYALLHFAIDLAQLEQRPIFFSPAVFPIYKYNPTTNRVEEHYGPVFAWLAGLWLLMIWSYLTTFSVNPSQTGAMLNVAIMQVLIISIVYFMSLSQGILIALKDVDSTIIKKAWCMTKSNYVQNQNIIKREELKTYKDVHRAATNAKELLVVMMEENKNQIEAVQSGQNSATVIPQVAGPAATRNQEQVTSNQVSPSVNIGQATENQISANNEQATENQVSQIGQAIAENQASNANQQQPANPEPATQPPAPAPAPAPAPVRPRPQPASMSNPVWEDVIQKSLALRMKEAGKITGRVRRKDKVEEECFKLRQVGNSAMKLAQIQIKQCMPPAIIAKSASMPFFDKGSQPEVQQAVQSWHEEIDNQVRDSFMREYQQLVQFTMHCVQTVDLNQASIIHRCFKFIEENMELLNAMGINIVLPTSGPLKDRWKLVQSQVQDLDDLQKLAFQKVYLNYVNINSKLKEEIAAINEEEKAIVEQRQKEQEEARRQKEEQLRRLQQEQQKPVNPQPQPANPQPQPANPQPQPANPQQVNPQPVAPQFNLQGPVDVNTDITDMPDCLLKYQIIVAKANQGQGKWTDNKFTASDESIGFKNMARFNNCKWERLADKNKDYAIFQDGAGLDDIIQGKLGTCYFLSALTLLSDKDVRSSFIFVGNENEWKKCGAFCVRFFNDGIEDYVIVDDYIPMQEGKFKFASCRNKNEIWVAIMEKAYAKKYGSFGNIEGGIIGLALYDLLRGVPTFGKTNDFNTPVDLFNHLMELQKMGEGVYMGAASPSHPKGDQAKSTKGIRMGHAYSIIKLVEVDGNYLIQLRNPWGYGEWQGDWCDKSELWTTRIRNIVEQAKGRTDVKEDGLFWMSIQDFQTEFKNIHSLRTFDPAVWKSVDIQGEWKGPSAVGRGTPQNPRPDCTKLPQYLVTMHQPDDAYIVLRCHDRQIGQLSKHWAFVEIANNNGQKLTQTDPQQGKVLKWHNNKELASGTVIPFPKNISYPCKFTMMVSSSHEGKEGEFNFTVYSHDPRMEVHPMQ